MVVLSGKQVAMYIKNIISNKQIQVNGVDLTLDTVYTWKSEGLLEDGRSLPEYIEIKPDGRQIYNLRPGAYLIRYSEVISIPKDAIGIVLPRSSLMRMGATICSAVWDSGYIGRGVGLLIVFNPFGIRIKKYARIAQIIFIKAEAAGVYEGEYKGEGLNPNRNHLASEK